MTANIFSNLKSGINTPTKTYGILKDNQVYMEFDMIEECSYTRQIEITDYPLENSRNSSNNNTDNKNKVNTRITEYAYDTPDIIEMVGYISYESLLYNQVATKIKEDYKSRVEETIQKLNLLANGIYKLQIKTRSGTRQYFTLQKYSIPENLDNFTNLQVEMTFKQVITVADWNNQQRNSDNNNTINAGNTQPITI